MKRLSSLLPLAAIFLASCSTDRPMARSDPRFFEENKADIVVRHYSENVNRIVKPLQMDGPFLTSLDVPSVLDLAKQQAGRELAVVVLLQCNCSDQVKQNWLTSLRGIGYKRVVFLLSENARKVNGSPILENPGELTARPKSPTAPNA